MLIKYPICVLVCLRTKSILIINQTVIKLIIGSIDLNEIALRHVLAIWIGQVCLGTDFQSIASSCDDEGVAQIKSR